MPPTHGETSTYCHGANRGKRSIALDLRDPEDVAVARELARRADHSFLPERAGCPVDQTLD